MKEISDGKPGIGTGDPTDHSLEQWRSAIADLSERLHDINRITEEDFVSVGASLEDLSHHFRRTLEGAKRVLSESSGRGADNILIKLGSIMEDFGGAPRARDRDDEDVGTAVGAIYTALKEFVQGVEGTLRGIARDAAGLDMLIQDMVVAVQFQDITRQAVDSCIEAVNAALQTLNRGKAAAPGNGMQSLSEELARSSFAQWEKLVLVRHQLNDAKMTIRMSMNLAGDLLTTVTEKVNDLVEVGGRSVREAEILRQITRSRTAAGDVASSRAAREMDDLLRLLRATVQEFRILDNGLEDAQRVVTGRIAGPMGRIESHWEDVDRELKEMAGQLRKVHGLALRQAGGESVPAGRLTGSMVEKDSQPGSVELF